MLLYNVSPKHKVVLSRTKNILSRDALKIVFILPRTLLGHIGQESEPSESDDSVTSTDDSRDSVEEELPSTSQLKITDTF